MGAAQHFKTFRIYVGVECVNNLHIKRWCTSGVLKMDGLNMLKKHNKPRKEGEKGQRVEIPRKIDISNAMIVCPKCGKPSRIAYKTEGEKKVRVCKKCQAEI